MKKALRQIRPVLVTFVIGLGMGVVYWSLHTQSPAPALLGLAGLLGIVVGEKITGFCRTRLAAPMREAEAVEEVSE